MAKKTDKTKKKVLHEELVMDTGMTAVVSNGEIVVSKSGKEVKRKIIPVVTIVIEGNKIILDTRKNSKNERKVFGSMVAHVKNIIQGLNDPFIYRLQAVNVHFPMTIKIDGNQLVIKNFLGEKKDRVVELVPGVDIKIVKDVIEIQCSDIEKAGMLAAKIEKKTKIRLRDRRVFQDGIYIVEKPGRTIV